MARISQAVTFPGAAGYSARRAARPAVGIAPHAYILFAHCFTCSKDSRAASFISEALTDAGFAVLRFDFTGLGDSEGDFANTTFSSNTADLLAAAAWLRRERKAPAILVGHSLGGAAVLAAAASVPESVAVATINAPADPAHVAHLFADRRDEIDAVGEALGESGVAYSASGGSFSRHRRAKTHGGDRGAAARVDRVPFPSRHDRRHRQRLAHLSGGQASEELHLARGRGSFLNRRADARYVGEQCSPHGRVAICRRSLADRPGVDPPRDSVLVRETRAGKFQQEIRVGPHRLLADEPTSAGGDDSGPSPYDLLTAALGACTAMTLRLYADRKQLPLDRVRVTLRHTKIHANDCGECETKEGRIDRIERVIELDGPLDDAAREKLLEIADKCPVHRTLQSEVLVPTRLAADQGTMRGETSPAE